MLCQSGSQCCIGSFPPNPKRAAGLVRLSGVLQLKVQTLQSFNGMRLQEQGRLLGRRSRAEAADANHPGDTLSATAMPRRYEIFWIRADAVESILYTNILSAAREFFSLGFDSCRIYSQESLQGGLESKLSPWENSPSIRSRTLYCIGVR